jgi:hypothetical protein
MLVLCSSQLDLLATSAAELPLTHNEAVGQ